MATDLFCFYMILKYIPNTLTLLRFALIAPFLYFIHKQEYTSAFYIFLIAGFTDGLDGWLARQFKWQSAFGSLIDPLADKFLIVTSFFALAWLGSLPWWLVDLVFLRDLTISVGVILWFCFIRQKLEAKPTFISKINTVLQLALVSICLFEKAFFVFPSILINILIFATAFTTITSYIDYVWIWGKKACT